MEHLPQIDDSSTLQKEFKSILKQLKKECSRSVPASASTLVGLPPGCPAFEPTNDSVRVSTKLGQGAFGAVFKATVRTNDNQLLTGALKLARKKAGAESLLTELRVQAAVPKAARAHIVRPLAIALDTSGTRVYAVLYELHDCTLARRIHDRIARLGSRKPTSSRPLFTRNEYELILGTLAQTLACIHAHGVFHCDVKPSNVLCCADGRIVLSDFGIATLVRGDPSRHILEDRIGTERYMAPEIRRSGGVPLNATVDTYPLALIAAELMTGKDPSDARPRHRAGIFAQRLPLHCRELIAAALDEDRAKRPPLEAWLRVFARPRSKPGSPTATSFGSASEMASVAERAHACAAVDGQMLSFGSDPIPEYGTGDHEPIRGQSWVCRPGSGRRAVQRGPPGSSGFDSDSCWGHMLRMEDSYASGSSRSAASESGAEDSDILIIPGPWAVQRSTRGRPACSGPSDVASLNRSFQGSYPLCGSPRFDSTGASSEGTTATSSAAAQNCILLASPPAAHGVLRRTRSACSGPSFCSEDFRSDPTDSYESRASSGSMDESCRDDDSCGADVPRKMSTSSAVPCPPRRSRSACTPASLPSTRPPSECGSSTDSAPSHARRTTSAAAPASDMSKGSLREHRTGDSGAGSAAGDAASPPLLELWRKDTPEELCVPGAAVAPPHAIAHKRPPLDAVQLTLLARHLQRFETVTGSLPMLHTVDTAETPRVDGGSEVFSALATSPGWPRSMTNSLYDSSSDVSPEISPRVLPSALRQRALMPVDAAMPPASRAVSCKSAVVGPVPTAREALCRQQALPQAAHVDGVRVALIEEEVLGMGPDGAESETAVAGERCSVGEVAKPRQRWRRRLSAMFSSLVCFRHSACSVEQGCWLRGALCEGEGVER